MGGTFVARCQSRCVGIAVALAGVALGRPADAVCVPTLPNGVATVPVDGATVPADFSRLWLNAGSSDGVELTVVVNGGSFVAEFQRDWYSVDLNLPLGSHSYEVVATLGAESRTFGPFTVVVDDASHPSPESPRILGIAPKRSCGGEASNPGGCDSNTNVDGCFDTGPPDFVRVGIAPDPAVSLYRVGLHERGSTPERHQVLGGACNFSLFDTVSPADACLPLCATVVAFDSRGLESASTTFCPDEESPSGGADAEGNVQDGCACRAAGSTERTPWWGGVGLVGAIYLLRKRKQRAVTAG